MSTYSYPGLLARGAGAGAVAGAAAGLVGLLVVEPSLAAALAVEHARSSGGGGHEEMFSRGVQVAGGVVAAIVAGIALGAVFATAFRAAHPRLPGASEFGRSVALAAVGFTVAGLLPAIKYPANPPGVGEPATVTFRTVAYLTLILAGVIIAYGIARLRDAVAVRTAWPAPWRATLVAGAATVAVVTVLVAWPASPDGVPTDVPPTLLWRFRLASLAEVFTLWATLGLAFGLLTDRHPAPPWAATAPPAPPRPMLFVGRVTGDDVWATPASPPCLRRPFRPALLHRVRLSVVFVRGEWH